MPQKSKQKDPVYVTRPYLPPLDEYIPYLEKIWESRVLTNNGPFHQELELKLCKYLGVPYVSLFTNATIALITAFRAMELTGEVITTPFSFVATAHSLLWNGLKPVFADIEEETFNLDPASVEKLITAQTSAILPVHVYGYPCRIDEFRTLSQKYNLKLIYDAAHTFGAKYRGKSICSFGDISVLSFHATKVFNTFEGGAIVCHDEKTKTHIDYLKNFGFASETEVVETGINGKMNELQAAMGILQLNHLDEAIRRRELVFFEYQKRLQGIPGITLPPEIGNFKSNYGYFPVRIDESAAGFSRDNLYNLLKVEEIYSRRYFYPLINSFKSYLIKNKSTFNQTPKAIKISNEILCFPIYPELGIEDLDRIFSVLSKIRI